MSDTKPASDTPRTIKGHDRCCAMFRKGETLHCDCGYAELSAKPAPEHATVGQLELEDDAWDAMSEAADALLAQAARLAELQGAYDEAVICLRESGRMFAVVDIERNELRQKLADAQTASAAYKAEVESLIKRRDELTAQLAEALKFEAEVARLNTELAKRDAERKSHRWNIQEDGTALLVYKGYHDTSVGCNYTRYIPEDEHNVEVGQLREELNRAIDGRTNTGGGS
jgi:hypothetical protein